MALESDGNPPGLAGTLRSAIARVVRAVRAVAAAKSGRRFSAGETGLPEPRGEPRVVLMVVNPYLVHAYWDCDPAAPRPQGGRAVLRFHDATGDLPPAHFDVDVDLRTRSWYLHLWSPARSYYADLGWAAEDGGFLRIARSNRVETPRAWPVAELEPRFGLVAGSRMEGQRACLAQAEAPAPPGPSDLTAATEQRFSAGVSSRPEC